MIQIGSLCTGYGGLDSAVQEVLGGALAWVADNDPGAAAVLAHHHPDAPNLGDITAVNWADVPSVDIVTAGFPCQDISYAGLGAGIQKGNRSGLWHTIADALGLLRPRVFVAENVAGIVVRRPGLDVVLADLARLGFDAVWTCVRASDAGAPHRRERWFLVASYPDGLAWQAGRAVNRRPGPVGKPASLERALRPAGVAVPDPDRDAHGPERHGDQVCRQAGDEQQRVDAVGRPVDWGRYRPAVLRWERITGRRVPVPRIPTGRDGSDQLNPVFVEWLMGLPAGHVTAVPGLSRNQQLTLLGNGVVPQQAAHALRLLLPDVEVAA